MDLLLLSGYAASLFIGLSLGLIGGGGTILAVPILVYLLGVDPSNATAYSLFVVGFTAAIGAYRAHGKGSVNVRVGLLFGIPAIIAVFFTRYQLFPMIPEQFALLDFQFEKNGAVMVLFAVLMLIASITMIRENEDAKREEVKGKTSSVLIIGEGLVVGVLTGLVGAGGGFIIIPALIFLGKLDMKTAIGTSLMIIALKSLIGFSGDVLSGRSIDWVLLASVTALAVVGIYIGTRMSALFSSAVLQKSFGWFVLIVGSLILFQELSFA